MGRVQWIEASLGQAETASKKKTSLLPLLWVPVIGVAAYIFAGTLKPPRRAPAR